MKTISFDIHAGKDGGVGIYEMIPDQAAELVFGGNLEEATKYLNRRIGEVINTQVKAELPLPKPVYKNVNLTQQTVEKVNQLGEL
jgi:hypothetical protein